jgi:hypothetical protein
VTEDDSNPYSPPAEPGAYKDRAPGQPSVLSRAVGAAILGCLAIFLVPIVGLLSFTIAFFVISGVLAANQNVETYAQIGASLSALVGMGLAIWILVTPAVRLLRDEAKSSTLPDKR